MKRDTLVVLGASVLALVSVTSWCSIIHASSMIEDSAQQILREVQYLKARPVQTLASSWTSGGVTHTVTTTRGTDESEAAFIQRHNATLNLALQQYPPDN